MSRGLGEVEKTILRVLEDMDPATGEKIIEKAFQYCDKPPHAAAVRRALGSLSRKGLIINVAEAKHRARWADPGWPARHRYKETIEALGGRVVQDWRTRKQSARFRKGTPRPSKQAIDAVLAWRDPVKAARALRKYYKRFGAWPNAKVRRALLKE